jgi:mono/diheme cytochrome c family protein
MSLSRILAGAALAAFALCSMQAAIAQSRKTADKRAESQLIERGRYIVKIGGCNDCHTPGYPQSGGKVPEKDWLVGDQVGWQGPWGTTYPSNLRLSMQNRTEEEWIKMARTVELRPPMPWFALRDMTTQDLRALYRFVRYLGPAGEPAPAYVPPGQEAKGPVIRFPAPPK